MVPESLLLLIPPVVDCGVCSGGGGGGGGVDAEIVFDLADCHALAAAVAAADLLPAITGAEGTASAKSAPSGGKSWRLSVDTTTGSGAEVG